MTRIAFDVVRVAGTADTFSDSEMEKRLVESMRAAFPQSVVTGYTVTPGRVSIQIFPVAPTTAPSGKIPAPTMSEISRRSWVKRKRDSAAMARWRAEGI